MTAEPSEDLIAEVHVELERLADPERAAEQQRYMRSEMAFLGIRVPVVRRVAGVAARTGPR